MDPPLIQSLLDHSHSHTTARTTHFTQVVREHTAGIASKGFSTYASVAGRRKAARPKRCLDSQAKQPREGKTEQSSHKLVSKTKEFLFQRMSQLGLRGHHPAYIQRSSPMNHGTKKSVRNASKR